MKRLVFTTCAASAVLLHVLFFYLRTVVVAVHIFFVFFHLECVLFAVSLVCDVSSLCWPDY